MTDLRLRPATWRDALRIRRWRNDTSTRRWMRNTSKIGLFEHLRWYWKVMRDSRRVLYVAERDGTPVGSGRLDLSPYLGAAEIDVVIAPGWRGRHIGRKLIRQLCRKAGQAVRYVLADVRSDNEASEKAFRAAGFSTAGTRDGYVRLIRRAG